MNNLHDSEVRAAIGQILDLAPLLGTHPGDVPVGEPKTSNTGRPVAIAAGIVVAVGALGLLVVSTREQQPSTPPSASPHESLPTSGDPAFDAKTYTAAVAACAPAWEALRSTYESTGDFGAELPSTPTPGPLIPLPNASHTARQVMFAPPVMFSCTVSVSEQPIAEGSRLSSAMLPSSSVGADDIDLMDGLTISISDNGPGTVLSVGRLGSNVVAVEIELEDGTVATAGIADGWFAVEIPVAKGVSIEPHRYNWTLDDSTERSADPEDIISPN